uniref:SprT-like domain-containing protein n=1 Tax=Setaria italica TaxID=4555 RepID=K3ZS78_SETIT
MIHAIIYVKHHRKDRSHGPLFRAWMDAINSCSIKDHQKPDGGYNITTRHDFSPEEPHSLLKGTLWKCGSCGDTHFRATNQGPPSDACCIENVKMSGSNGKPQGSSSVKKAGKRRWPEVVPETSVLLAEFPRKSKGKQDLVAAEDDLFSLVSCGAPKSSRSSKKVVKADMQRKPEDVQKPSGLPASPQGKPNQKKVGKQHKPDDQKPSVLPSTLLGTPKLKHALVTTEKDKPFSAEGCNDTKSLGSTSKKAEEQHEPQIAQKACSQTAYPQKILKPDLKAGEWHEPQIAQKACSQPAYPQKILKQELAVLEKKEPSPTMGCSNEKLLDRSSSKKAHRQHEPEDIRKTTVLPAAPGSKPKASGFVASGNQRKGKCKRKPVREKEYAVMSAYLDYYESDRSSGSTESLVNKRTERRKRERERARILTYSRSKKLNPAAPLVYSRTNASVSSHRIEMLPHRDGLIQQSLPPPPCSDNAILTTANQVVVTEATGDHSEPSAPCLDIVPLQPAEPPGLTPPDQSTAPDIIDISDDDLP